MKKLTLILTLLLSFGALAEEPKKVSYSNFVKNNIANIEKVKEGMTIEEVKEIMGNDYYKHKRHTYSNPMKEISKDGITQLLYQTSKHRKYRPINEATCTYLSFRDGKLFSKTDYTNRIRLDDKYLTKKAENPEPESTEERLRKLKGLYEEGFMDKETYDAQVKRIINDI